MHHFIPGPKCTKCGSEESETFFGMGVSGHRCLNCGHEKIDSHLSGGILGETEETGWSSSR